MEQEWQRAERGKPPPPARRLEALMSTLRRNVGQVERVARVLAQLCVDKFAAGSPAFASGDAFAEMARSKLGGELGSVGRSKGWEHAPAPKHGSGAAFIDSNEADLDVRRRFFALVRGRMTVLRNRLAGLALTFNAVSRVTRGRFHRGST